MPSGLQANNLGPMGFGQPNMNRAAGQQPGPGYGMPARPVPPGQQPGPQAPPGGAGRSGKPNPFLAAGVPSLYASPLGQEAMKAKPGQFPADAVYKRVQSAILNPGPPAPPMPPPPPQAPPPPQMGGMMPPRMPQMPGMPPMPGMMPGMPPMPPGMMPPPPPGMRPPPMPGMPQPQDPNEMAAAMAFMQQQLGGLV